MKKRILSLILTIAMIVCMIPSTTFTMTANAVASSSWAKLSGSTGGQTIGASGKTYYYYVTENTTCSNTNTGGSGLTIAGGATVYIYIAPNVTLTCTGKAGSGTTGGGAGIWCPQTPYCISSVTARFPQPAVLPLREATAVRESKRLLPAAKHGTM